MHQLILLRHAKAARGSPEVADHDRPLTPEGRKTAAAMGTAMRSLGLTPDVVLVSSALRTEQTLDELEPWEDRPNIEILPTLYMASYHQIRDILRDLPETLRCVLVIGHNPGIHDLARLLAGEAVGKSKPEFARLAEEYPTASLCEFLVPTLWRKLGPPEAAAGAPGTCTTLQRYIQPSDLPSATRPSAD